jgi:hypothetical protein
MNTKEAYGKNNPAPRQLGTYFGLRVEIIFRMRNCSLIRWRDRQCIVDTEDLQMVAERCAA